MASKNIAVAGGTGGIGRHIVESLLSIQPKYSLSIIVLSRTPQDPIQFESSSAPVIAVDYKDPDSIEAALRDASIDTVISTLSGSEEAFVNAQQNLLTAALKVPTFRRFAPSEFASDSEKVGEAVKFLSFKLPILRSLRQVKLERPSFEFTKFNTGTFMNYLAFGNPKPNGEKALGYLKHFPYMLDLSTKKADFPGDGEGKMRVTSVEDIGKFVAAATQLNTWPEESEMAGDEIKLNDLVKMAERIAGVTIEVKYNTMEEIRSRMDPNPAAVWTNFFHETYLAFLEGKTDLVGPANLNELTDVKPMKVEEFLRIWWGQ